LPGVFNSHLTQGNTNFNVLLSICTSQFNLAPEKGQRIFVAMDERQYLLGVPSAFEIGINHCRWIYKHGESCFQVRTWTSGKVPQVHTDFSDQRQKGIVDHYPSFDAAAGNIPAHTTGEYVARPKADSMIASKFPQAQFRITVNSAFPEFRACSDEVLYPGMKGQGGSLFVLCVQETLDFCMSITGEVCFAVQTGKIKDADKQWLSDCQDARSFWQELCLHLSLKGEHKDTAAIQEILPWYGMNALTHFLTPYGLEQFSGAAWGTRDVARTVDLLCMERKLHRCVFCFQPESGWRMGSMGMFDSSLRSGADSSHGDVLLVIVWLSNI
jgi:cellobiose phosphorylase